MFIFKQLVTFLKCVVPLCASLLRSGRVLQLSAFILLILVNNSDVVLKYSVANVIILFTAVSYAVSY